MPLLQRKRVILAKIETTYGTDPVPTGAANAILVRNLNVSPQDADFVDRDLVRPYLGRSEQLPAAIRATVDFEVEIAGAGAAGTVPGYGPLLRACGLSETITASTKVDYAPISASFESVTIYLNNDGVLHKLTGARGTVSIQMKVKDIPVFKFQFTGLYNAVSDVALPAPTYSAFQTPLTVTNVNTTPFTLHGYSAVLSDFQLDLTNSIVHRTLVGGSEAVLITDREPQGSMTIEATTVTAKDWWSLAKAATLGALDITHGITGGNKVQITSSRVQLTKPQYQDMDGVSMLQFGTNYIPSSAGNDELLISVK